MSLAEQGNKFLIRSRGGKLEPLLPIPWPLEPGDCLILAAWLVMLADPDAMNDFQTLLDDIAKG